MKTLFCILCITLLSVTLPAQQTAVSTSKDTKRTSLSIYNEGFGIVRQQRNLMLQSGTNLLRFEDVAARIDPTSISIKSLNHSDALSVREQNYQYDLLNPVSILNKSVGKTIRFRRSLPNGQSDVIEGTLLNPPVSVVYQPDQGGSQSSYNDLVIRTNDNKIILNPIGEMILDEVPTGLVSKPSLLWKLNNSHAGEHLTEVAYMSEGLQWSANYVTVLNDADSKVDLNGWVTLNNQSGTTYHDAQLQLVAGSVRRVQEAQPMLNYKTMMRADAMEASAPFQEQSFFEYHLYTLDGTTTLADNETKQMQLLAANNVDVRKKLVFDAERYHSYVRTPGDGSSTEEIKAAIIVELKNSKANNMGMPLPKGKVRVYKADSQGRLQFLGEDNINHTPSDETVRLYIGDAFDVVGTRVQKDYKQSSKRSTEISYEVTIRNHKNTTAEVSVVEHGYGDWEVIGTNAKNTRIDASTIEFPLTLAKDESKTISYTVRTKW